MREIGNVPKMKVRIEWYEDENGPVTHSFETVYSDRTAPAMSQVMTAAVQACRIHTNPVPRANRFGINLKGGEMISVRDQIQEAWGKINATMLKLHQKRPTTTSDKKA